MNEKPFKVKKLSDALTEVTSEINKKPDFKVKKYADVVQLAQLERMQKENQPNFLEKAAKTVGNVGTNIGKGVIKGAESTLDFAVGVGSGIGNFVSTPFKSEEDRKKSRDKITSFISKDLTSELMTNVGWTPEMKTEWERGSAVTESNLGGQVSQAAGGLMFDILAGKALGTAIGFKGKALTATKGLKGTTKVKAVGKNVLKSMATPTTAMRSAKSIGGNLEQAYQAGADDVKAITYALTNTVGEIVIESLVGGIPGTQAIGWFDNLGTKIADLGIKTVKKEGTKQLINFASNLGFKVIGEGVEEGLQQVLSSVIEKATINPNKEIWNGQEVLEAALVGGILGGLFEAPRAFAERASYNLESIATNPEVLNEKTAEQVKQNIQQDTKQEVANKPLDELDAKIQQLEDSFSRIDIKLDQKTIDNNYAELNKLREQKRNVLLKQSEETKVAEIAKLEQEIKEIEQVPVEEQTPIAQEVVADKKQTMETLIEAVDKDKPIKTTYNRKYILDNKTQIFEQATTIVNNLNQERPSDKPIEIQPEETYTPSQKRLADVAAVFKKQVVFLNNADFGGMVPLENENIIFINDKVDNELVLSNIETDKITYAVGHELFHSLKRTYPDIFNEFTDFVKADISEEQLIKFMDKYDPVDKYGLLKGTQVDGKFNLAELKQNPDKYKKQIKSLNYIVEEMVANEFGGMITDKTYMTNLKNKNKGLFTKVVNALKELFTSIDTPVYDSPLTQMQITKIRNDFEFVSKFLAEELEVKKEVKPTEVKAETPKQEVKKTEVKEEKLPVKKVEVKKDVKQVDVKKEALPKKEVKKPLPKKEKSLALTKEEEVRLTELASRPLVDKTPQKITKMDMGTRLTYINKTLDRYNQETNSKNKNELLKAAARAYDNYKKDGGKEIIQVLEDVKKQTDDAKKQQLKEKLNIKDKMLPSKEQYAMSHRPSEGPQAFDLLQTNDDISGPKDIYENPQYYTGTLNKQELQETMSVLNKAKGNPNATITIYRATPGNQINNGDWITLSESYAKQHNESQFDGKGNVLELKVRAKDIRWAMDDLSEWGYFPENNKMLPNLGETFKKVFNNNAFENYINGEENNTPLTENDYKISNDYIREIENKTRDYFKDTDTVKMMSVEELKPLLNRGGERSNKQVRDLLESIKQNGITKALQIKTKNKKLILDDGNHRLDIAIKLGLKNIPVRIANEDNKYLPTKEEQGVSKFATNTVQKSIAFSDVASEILNNPELYQYSRKTHDEARREGLSLMKTAPQETIDKIMRNDSVLTPGEKAFALLMKEYYKQKGDKDSGLALVKILKESDTRGGQSVEASKLYQDDPDFIVEDFKNMLDKMYEDFKTSKDPTIMKWMKDHTNGIKLTEGEETYLYNMADKLKGLDENSDEYRTRIALINTYIANKMPKEFWTKVKNFRRMGFLFNPKTIIRNWFGNISMVPVYKATDLVGSKLDKVVSEQLKTQRTTGTFIKDVYKEGQREGKRASKRDYQLGILTGLGNPHEVGEGQTFSDKNVIGKTLNEVEKLTNYLMARGDRGYEQGHYLNTLTNLMRLNGVETATEEMIQIAKDTASKRTWKNSGKMVQVASGIRKLFNAVGIKDGKLGVYTPGTNVSIGLGDVILPFIMTPANLLVATYDFSPAAALTSMKTWKDLKTAIKDGKNIQTAQKAFVDSTSRAMVGTLLYIVAGAMAKMGVITGGEDEDKDKRELDKILGNQPFSIKIGNTSYTYDWLQPLSNIFATMGEVERQKTAEKTNFAKLVGEAFTVGGDRLLEQSFLQNVKTLLGGSYNDDKSLGERVVDLTADIPSSMIPTLFKQTADFLDPNIKTTYDKNSPLQTMLSKTMARIPFVKSALPTKKDVLGNDLKYHNSFGTGILTSFLSPMNIKSDVAGDLGDELVDVLNHTGDKTIIPQVAIKYIDYDSNKDGKTERFNFNPSQQSKLQEAMGKIVSDSFENIFANDVYMNATYNEKATALKSLMEYAKGKALEESGLVPDYLSGNANLKQIKKYIDSGLDISDSIMYDSIINYIEGDLDSSGKAISGTLQGKKAFTIMNMQISDNAKNTMLDLITTAKVPETINTLSKLKTQQDFINYYSLNRSDTFVSEKFSRDDYDMATKTFKIKGDTFIEATNGLSDIKADKNSKGETIEDSRKKKVIKYINSIRGLTSIQKTYLYGVAGYSIKAYKNDMYKYINSLPMTKAEKAELWKNLGF